MYLSVIIPTYNRNDLLTDCLKLLSPDVQSIDKQFYEVIITDDSINNISKDLADRFPWAKFIEGPKRGPAANRNNGAKQAIGDWLIFIDDDCLPDKDVIKAYYQEIMMGEYKALEGLTDADRPRKRYDEISPVNLYGGHFWSCNIAIEKALFIQIEGFDEGFPFPDMEDIDFFTRLKKVAQHKFLPEAKVIHPWRHVIPFKSFKKRVRSNQYNLEKYRVKRGFSYRFQRLKLMVGLFRSEFLLLMKYSFTGVGVFLDRMCFQFVMLFI